LLAEWADLAQEALEALDKHMILGCPRNREAELLQDHLAQGHADCPLHLH
jgi:hypothetical protein